MDTDGVTAYLKHLYGALMEVEPDARPILRRLFFATATRDWVTDGPPDHVMDQASAAMSAMHRAMDYGDYPEALTHMKVWATVLGVDG